MRVPNALLIIQLPCLQCRAIRTSEPQAMTLKERKYRRNARPSSRMHSFDHQQRPRLPASLSSTPIRGFGEFRRLQDNAATPRRGLLIAISPVPALTDLSVFFIHHLLRPDRHMHHVGGISLEAAFYSSLAHIPSRPSHSFRKHTFQQRLIIQHPPKVNQPYGAR